MNLQMTLLLVSFFVTVVAGAPVNVIVGGACQSCSRSFVNETPITVTVA